MSEINHPVPKQEELADPDDGKPIAAGPDRDPELHALGLELIELEGRKKDAIGAEKAKREEAGAALRSRGLREYDVDGVAIWIEGKETVKVKRDGGRPKGKVTKEVAGPAQWGPDDEDDD